MYSQRPRTVLKNTNRLGHYLHPKQRAALREHARRIIEHGGPDCRLLAYHKRRKRSRWKTPNGSIITLYA